MVYGTVVVDINAMNESLARLDDTIARLEAATYKQQHKLNTTTSYCNERSTTNQPLDEDDRL